MANLLTHDTTELDQLDARDYIIIKGARVNNLKNLSVAIPRNQLVVITGLSGSGKSSLAFDTLFAEGRRMYVESLSSYARQFLGNMQRPAVDYIRGVAPAIAIEQKRQTKHPRSTVGTITEIYDYLKLLYARVGTTYSPTSGKKVTKDNVSDVVDYINQHEGGSKVMILAPIKIPKERSLVDAMKIELGKGFTRIMQGKELLAIEEIIAEPTKLKEKKPFYLLVDRVVVDKEDEDNQFRIADSVQTTFFEGEGSCLVEVVGKGQKVFSDRFELDGITFEEPSVNLFSFNNPYGICKACEGKGQVIGIDQEKVIPNQQLSVVEGAILPWKPKNKQSWLKPLLTVEAKRINFPLHKAYNKLSDEQKGILWHGHRTFRGIYAFFQELSDDIYSYQHGVLLSRYKGPITCQACKGTRIRKDAAYVKVGDHSIMELLLMPVEYLTQFFDKLTVDPHQQAIAARLLREIRDRLGYLEQVGLGYLTLNRQAATLSGGEYQRIKLATSLGSTLVGTMYILDEPTVGLHPRDTRRLTDILIALKHLGNTVIVVEHEEMVMRAADQLIDIGPEAGSGGGELIFQGDWEALTKCKKGHTARYMNGLATIAVPTKRRSWKHKLLIQQAHENNLKHIDVTIPLGVLTVVTGVSGSGKSTLIKDILYPALRKHLKLYSENGPGKFGGLSGDLDKITHVDFVDQNPIGQSSRSNPISYVGAYEPIRNLFARQPLARERGYYAGHFSFNVHWGCCEECNGEGETQIEMQFMADVFLPCESCGGKRFKEEIREVTYRDKSIDEVLVMTVDDALGFFADESYVVEKLLPLKEVGLGYIQLGQSSNSLSGGEAQRVKLASYLVKDNRREHTLFIFDEPTTGLHIHDINKLLKAIYALIKEGNSVIVIEHNMEVIKCADWIIDLGPEGGERGGELVFSGTPEEMKELKEGHTAQYLKEKLR